MRRIYFDNAATTAIDPLVLEAMMPYFSEKFGNPSSIYSYGRETRMAVEQARKSVARILNTTPGEIFFTSGGTESNNAILHAAVRDLGCTRILSTSIEHHAVSHTIEHLCHTGQVKTNEVRLLPNGHVDLQHLEKLLAASSEKTLVSLMHANNEIGNILDIKAVGALCARYQAYFHSDTVQTIGHFPLDLQSIPVHFITGAAHKFHGPKGVGLLYIRHDVRIHPFIFGGGQERNMRAGTENLYGVVGFAKALELAESRMSEDHDRIQSLKTYLIERLKERGDVVFNGDAAGKSLYTVLNASFPRTEQTEMLLMNLDMRGICVSGGSACSSGAEVGSHVIRALPSGQGRVPVRFSFSRYNSREELDLLMDALQACC